MAPYLASVPVATPSPDSSQQDRQMHVIDQVRPVCDVPISALQAWLGGQHLCQRCLFFSEPSIAEVIGVRYHTVIG